jgi:hypothetical protein
MLESYGFIEMYLVVPGLKLWRAVKSKLATSQVSEVAVLVGGCA